MKWLRKIFGTDFPDPKVGQVWRCDRNGELMRVSDVHIHTSGTVFVTCTSWIPEGHWTGIGPRWGIGNSYAVGLSAWRWKLRAQSRKLVPTEEEPHAKPTTTIHIGDLAPGESVSIPGPTKSRKRGNQMTHTRWSLTGRARPRPGWRGRQVLQVEVRYEHYQMPRHDVVLSTQLGWLDATWQDMQALPGFTIGKPPEAFITPSDK